MNPTAFILDKIKKSEDSVTLAVGGYETAVIQVTGTWSGSLSLEGTIDGENWFAISGASIPDAVSTSSTFNNGQWRATVSGLFKARVRATVINSGEATVSILAVS